MRRATTISTPVLPGLVLPGLVLPGLVLLGPAAVLPAGATSTAGVTCQGLPATPVQVGPDGTLTGTEGDDVIVTAGAARTHALGGDDLVCVTGLATDPFVDAGAGNDRVDATAVTGAHAVLGTGSDRFDGSSDADVVRAGPGSDARSDEQPETATDAETDAETDVIDTGAYGGVDDEVVSGAPGRPNGDRITMKRGTLRWYGVATPDSAVDGGVWSELHLVAASARTVAVDNVAGTAAVDEQHRLSFRGFARFRVSVSGRGPRSLTVRGGDRVEEVALELGRLPQDARHAVRLGRGNDQLEVRSTGGRTVPRRTTYDGGPDRHDEIRLVLADERDLDLDLRRGRVSTAVGPRRATAEVTGFDHARVLARDVDLVGTDRANSLSVLACRTRVRAGGGRDQVRWVGRVGDAELRCGVPRARFHGGNGPDSLRGSPGPDLLVGGRDDDQARGRAGRDVCEAERAGGCEVRR